MGHRKYFNVSFCQHVVYVLPQFPANLQKTINTCVSVHICVCVNANIRREHHKEHVVQSLWFGTVLINYAKSVSFALFGVLFFNDTNFSISAKQNNFSSVFIQFSWNLHKEEKQLHMLAA